MRAPLALLLLSCGLGGGLMLSLPPLGVSFSLRLSEATSAGAASCATHSVTRVSCAAPHSPDALLAHPDHCQLFYYCEAGRERPTCRQCPAGLHFNSALHVCDWPQQAGCRTGAAPESTASTTPADAQPTTVAYHPTTTEANATWPWTTTAGPSISIGGPLSTSTALSPLGPTASTERPSLDATNSSSPWTTSAGTDNTMENTTPDARTWPHNTNWQEPARTVEPEESSINESGAYTAPSSVMWNLLN